jgi:CheY-like chemotaxis protein
LSTVLLIDDDVYFRRLLAPLLEAKGYRVLEAGRAADADRVLGGQHVDLLVLDGLLPDGDGVAWLEKQRRAGHNQPALFCSAFRRNLRDEQRLKTAGAQPLRKPIEPSAVLDAIDLALDRSPAKNSAEQRILELRAEYAAVLPGKLAELRAALHAVRVHPSDDSRYTTALRIAHRISGTSGSYGFIKLGEACAQIEEQLPVVRGADPEALAEWWRSMTNALIKTRAALDMEAL